MNRTKATMDPFASPSNKTSSNASAKCCGRTGVPMIVACGMPNQSAFRNESSVGSGVVGAGAARGADIRCITRQRTVTLGSPGRPSSHPCRRPPRRRHARLVVRHDLAVDNPRHRLTPDLIIANGRMRTNDDVVVCELWPIADDRRHERHSNAIIGGFTCSPRSRMAGGTHPRSDQGRGGDFDAGLCLSSWMRWVALECPPDR